MEEEEEGQTVDEFGRKRRIGEDVDANGESNNSLLPPARLVEGNYRQPLKKRRTKAVPGDYTCQACKNKHSPPHWIYDCPYKIRIPGNTAVAKKYRGINDPASRKVFVSGLPFDVKTKDVEVYFENEVIGGKVMHCKLFMFDDTKRCKGQGILTFGTDESAKRALELNGTVLQPGTFKEKNEKKKKKGNDESTEGKKKVLRLGVSKLQNRTVTKGKTGFAKK